MVMGSLDLDREAWPLAEMCVYFYESFSFLFD